MFFCTTTDDTLTHNAGTRLEHLKQTGDRSSKGPGGVVIMTRHKYSGLSTQELKPKVQGLGLFLVAINTFM